MRPFLSAKMAGSLTASAALFLFNVIEKKLPRASPTQEFSNSLNPFRTWPSLRFNPIGLFLARVFAAKC